MGWRVDKSDRTDWLARAKAKVLRSGSAAAVVRSVLAARLAQQRGEMTVTVHGMAGEIYRASGVVPVPPAPPAIPMTPGQRGYSRNRYL